jgi:2,3-bisphosphoglycerate-independent phosphoglycerate mutase
MADEKVAVLIIDGLGYDTDIEHSILREAIGDLPDEIVNILDGTGADVLSDAGLDNSNRELIRFALLTPTMTSTLARTPLWSNRAAVSAIKHGRACLREAIPNTVWEEEVLSRMKATATRHHYAPWVASTTTLWNLRNTFSTFPTRAAGIFAGFERLDPEIMGNSDTGHQQISNLTVAKQVPTWITEMIDDGSLYEDEKLVAAMQRARDGHLVVLKTMLSGEFGDDGYVHSAMRHLWALLDLYFNRLGLPKENLQLEIALDGRDSPDRSSTDEDEIDGIHRFDFLGKLRRHLQEKHDAVDCVSWIFGRQYMDRNYQGAMIRGEYELIVKNRGKQVADFDAAYAQVRQYHDEGYTDPMVPPIVIGQPRPVDGNTSYINAIFRADRQEPITAALLGKKDFIVQRAEPFGTIESWEDFAWMEDLSGLTMVSMIGYHASFSEAGVHAVVEDRPHDHNVLFLLNEYVPDFKFLFLGESVKAKHIGLFSRGRRSLPLKPAEDREIIPSYGKKEDVANDNELYKFPSMRHLELGAALERAGREAKHDFVLINWPGPDMIGHLITNHFESCVETVNSIEAVLNKVVPVLREAGYFVIITSDHGNVENYGPDHGNNPVLTTVIPPAGREDAIVSRYDAEARLFDVAATALYLMGEDETVRSKMPPIPDVVQQSPDRLVGVPLVRLAK